VDRHFQRDPAADALAHDMNRVEFQLIENVEIEEGEVSHIIHVVTGLGRAESRMFGRDDLEMARKFVKPWFMVGEALGAMQEQ
jgi:hypothetical protein